MPKNKDTKLPYFFVTFPALEGCAAGTTHEMGYGVGGRPTVLLGIPGQDTNPTR